MISFFRQVNCTLQPSPQTLPGDDVTSARVRCLHCRYLCLDKGGKKVFLADLSVMLQESHNLSNYLTLAGIYICIGFLRFSVPIRETKVWSWERWWQKWVTASSSVYFLLLQKCSHCLSPCKNLLPASGGEDTVVCMLFSLFVFWRRYVFQAAINPPL